MPQSIVVNSRTQARNSSQVLTYEKEEQSQRKQVSDMKADGAEASQSNSKHAATFVLSK